LLDSQESAPDGMPIGDDFLKHMVRNDMSVRDNARWRDWADRLRQQMMSGLTPQVTKSVDRITEETGTNKPQSVLRSRRFWNACQAGDGLNDTLVKAGFEIDFEPNDKSEIDTVTFRLNDTWKAIMQRVLDRRASSERREPS
jgi:hypothetical protein